MKRRKKHKKISLKGTRLFLITIAGLILMLIVLPYTFTSLFSNHPHEEGTENNQSQSNKKQQSRLHNSSLPDTITIYRTGTGKTEKIAFEEYVKGAVSCEMPSTFEEEALKAQAVAARTYSLAKSKNASKYGNPSAHPKAPLCDSVHCQVYKGEDELEQTKGSSWMKSGREKINKAVTSTSGQVMYYKGKLVQQALFHSSSGGKTENCQDVFASTVPYLVSVDSPYEDDATHQNEKTSFTLKEVSSKLNAAFPNIHIGAINNTNLKIIDHSSGGKVNEIRVGNATLTGRNIREALGLSSADFTFKISGDNITFTTNGSGHGVGMSQYGANGMAKKGYNYKDILKHYYNGVQIH